MEKEREKETKSFIGEMGFQNKLEVAICLSYAIMEKDN